MPYSTHTNSARARATPATHDITRAPTRKPFAELPMPQQAGILCNDPRFQKFAAIRSGLPDEQFRTSAAAEYLRTCCQITSRSQLSDDPKAQSKFQILRTEFDAWAGKIAKPRGDA